VAAATLAWAGLAGVPALAETPGDAGATPGGAAAPGGLEIPYQKVVLDNGLELILHEDRSLPLVAVNLWYHVGPANEPAGRSGFAHLFEHLMFEGSRHVGAEFDRLMESAGATNVNGTTSWDRTNYFETLPREQLELALWIESDRMGFMLETLSEERLEVQRGVVKNERRQSYENAPYGPSTLAMYDSLFPLGHPYHGAVIGSMQDLDAATIDDVRDFHRSFYAPSNATLVIAGDFDPSQALRWVQRYFGSLPKRAKPARRQAVTPPLAAPVQRVVEEPVELGRVAFAWIVPPAFSADNAVLDVTMALFAGGRATRLYQALVVGKKLSPDVSASLDSNQLASIAEVSAMVASGVSDAEVTAELEAQIEKLAVEGPSPAELARAKRRLLVPLKSEVLLLNGGGGESGRAGLLQRFNHYLGNPGFLSAWVGQIEAVSAADVQRAVRKHLGGETRATIVTRPKPGAGS